MNVRFCSPLLLLFPLAAEPPVSLRGFSQSEALEQWKLEERARSLPQSERIRTYLKRMSASPHHAGSAGSKAVAEYALGLFKEWGLEARIDTFEALLPYPTTRVVEMTAPSRHRLHLRESSFSEDKDTGDANQLPGFNAYSASGEVTAAIVYANYGLPEDYEHLARIGVSVKGRIVLVRYGRSWRGIKPKLAQEHGAAACLIYSDPHEDGFFQGDVYPRGPFRPPLGIQRGSVMDMPVGVGDPLTPGWASEKGAKRLPRDEAKTLMKIPVMPLSYEDATPLLKSLNGPVAPESWRGALGFTYHIGPGPTTVHMKLDFDWSQRPVYDVIATIPGAQFPDQWVIYGNHHDAWVNGASDPLSGASSLLETARVLAELRRQGWRPRRTIVFALWDAEEFGLVGSTEWVEKSRRELSRKLVAYINSDSNGRGTINAGGSHSLEAFSAEVLRDVRDPVNGKSLLDSRHDRTRDDFRLSALGAGSDYVPFLHHAGIASLNFGFGGADLGGVYHSIYDTFAWFTRFGDPDLLYGKALSQVTLTTLLRLAEAPLLPFEFTALARTISRYLEEIQKVAGKDGSRLEWKEGIAENNRLLTAAKGFEFEYANALRRVASLSLERRAAFNQAIFRIERSLTTRQGLPGRPWFRHQLYAPGLFTGYGAKTLPGLREAVEAGRWDEAGQQLRDLTQTLRNVQIELGKTAVLLREAAQ